MIRLEKKNYNTILIEKKTKYQLYDLTKLISMNILLVKKYYSLIKKNILEQAKFTYSPLGKAFERQIKTIEDQGKKQVEALKPEDLKPEEQKATEDKFDDKISMQKETYNRLLGKRLNEIKEISKKMDFNYLTYYFKISGVSPINFIKSKGPFSFFKEIRDGDKY